MLATPCPEILQDFYNIYKGKQLMGNVHKSVLSNSKDWLVERYMDLNGKKIPYQDLDHQWVSNSYHTGTTPGTKAVYKDICDEFYEGVILPYKELMLLTEDGVFKYKGDAVVVVNKTTLVVFGRILNNRTDVTPSMFFHETKAAREWVNREKINNNKLYEAHRGGPGDRIVQIKVLATGKSYNLGEITNMGRISLFEEVGSLLKVHVVNAVTVKDLK